MFRLIFLATLLVGCVTIAPSTDSPLAPVPSPVAMRSAAAIAVAPAAVDVVTDPLSQPVATPIQATPTPTATPLPTATPTRRPTPTPAPELNDGYFDFLLQQLEWTTTLQSGMEEISSASDSGRLTQMRPAVSDALDDARDVRLALLLVDVQPCFADSHDAWTAFVTTYVDALDKIEYGLTPPITLSDMYEGLALLEEAVNLMDDVTYEAGLVTCSTSSASS